MDNILKNNLVKKIESIIFNYNQFITQHTIVLLSNTFCVVDKHQ